MILRNMFLRGITALLITLPVIALMYGCASTAKPVLATCLPKKQNDLVITWQTSDDSAATYTGYRMMNNGELLKLSGPNPDSVTEELIFAVPHPKYCETVQDIQGTLLKIQALSVRGKRARSIDYISASSGLYLRAMWNPDLQTFQSRDARELFDRLMLLVPSED